MSLRILCGKQLEFELALPPVASVRLHVILPSQYPKLPFISIYGRFCCAVSDVLHTYHNMDVAFPLFHLSPIALSSSLLPFSYPGGTPRHADCDTLLHKNQCFLLVICPPFSQWLRVVASLVDRT